MSAIPMQRTFRREARRKRVDEEEACDQELLGKRDSRCGCCGGFLDISSWGKFEWTAFAITFAVVTALVITAAVVSQNFENNFKKNIHKTPIDLGIQGAREWAQFFSHAPASTSQQQQSFQATASQQLRIRRSALPNSEDAQQGNQLVPLTAFESQGMLVTARVSHAHAQPATTTNIGGRHVARAAATASTIPSDATTITEPAQAPAAATTSVIFDDLLGISITVTGAGDGTWRAVAEATPAPEPEPLPAGCAVDLANIIFDPATNITFEVIPCEGSEGEGSVSMFWKPVSTGPPVRPEDIAQASVFTAAGGISPAAPTPQIVHDSHTNVTWNQTFEGDCPVFVAIISTGGQDTFNIATAPTTFLTSVVNCLSAAFDNVPSSTPDLAWVSNIGIPTTSSTITHANSAASSLATALSATIGGS
ncbi:hypothetical protein ABW21_db0205407 [Orbilia brochopaga]|nr:hypothetical protein ABW21_db0205407 [Drechslerella brochopaga]